MARYRKIPVEVEAMQLRWDTWSEMCDFANVGRLTDGQPEGAFDGDPSEGRVKLFIPTPGGVAVAYEGQYVVRDVSGDFYPCTAEVFESTHDRLED